MLEGAWLTTDGLAQVLNGSMPQETQIRAVDQIWRSEPRVGIQRHQEKRTTARFPASDGQPERGALYAAAHVRPAKDVILAIEIEGFPDVRLDGVLVPLGGEGRSVWIERSENPIKLPAAPALRADADGKVRYTVIHITPAELGGDWPGPGDQLAGADSEVLPGDIVSACLGRPVRIGGWDGLKKQPLPLRSLIPTGSVWFLEAPADKAEAARRWHGQAVGAATEWGFGRVLIGKWEPAEEKQ